MKAKEKTFNIGKLGGGITFYPYQVTFGISLRYWPCIFAPSIRIHLLCFKFWLYLQLKHEQRQETASAVDTIVSALYKEINNKIHEEITISGTRINCIEKGSLDVIFEQFGYVHEPEF